MAAVGSRGQERYTRLFSAFDASGGPRMGWHWPACVSALNWLVYRSLWLWAVAALVVPALGLLLILGAARLVFGMSGSLLAPLALTLVVAWSVACGLFADAVYYKICTRRILLAVESSATIEEARMVLAAQSERRARWPAFAAADLVLVLLVTASVAVVGVGRSPREKAAGPAEHSGPVDESGEVGGKSVVPGRGPTSGPAASPASASIPAPTASASVSGNSNAVKSDHLAQAMVDEARATVASKTSSAPALRLGASPPAVPASQTITAMPGRTATPAPAPTLPRAPASAPSPAAPPAPPASAVSPSGSASAQAKKADKSAVTDEKKKEPSAAAKAPQKGEAKDVDRAPKGSGQFAVQIGIFAQETNASKALASARSTGLPAFVDTVNGDQQRVRAGPFTSQAEAESAARKIKDLDLPAVVVRMRKAGDAAASPTP